MFFCTKLCFFFWYRNFLFTFHSGVFSWKLTFFQRKSRVCWLHGYFWQKHQISLHKNVKYAKMMKKYMILSKKIYFWYIFQKKMFFWYIFFEQKKTFCLKCTTNFFIWCFWNHTYFRFIKGVKYPEWSTSVWKPTVRLETYVKFAAKHWVFPSNHSRSRKSATGNL